MKYVIGIDLGTSAVKLLLVNMNGKVIQEISKEYPLMQEKAGYSEQNPEDWVEQTIAGLTELTDSFPGDVSDIEGISFSGQMHGLVLLDENHDAIRPAILWNDTRTTKECQEITEQVGREKLLHISKNIALEGFTLPKIIWVKKYEPENYSKAKLFLLPKDYLRFRLTGRLHMDYSDAAGTLLLDIEKRSWSDEICTALDIDPELCPPLVPSHEMVGNIDEIIAEKTGLSEKKSAYLPAVLIMPAERLEQVFWRKEERWPVSVLLELFYLMRMPVINHLQERYITLTMLLPMLFTPWELRLLQVIAYPGLKILLPKK